MHRTIVHTRKGLYPTPSHFPLPFKSPLSQFLPRLQTSQPTSELTSQRRLHSRNPNAAPIGNTFEVLTSSPTPDQQSSPSHPSSTTFAQEIALPRTYFSLFPLSFPEGAPPLSKFTPDLRTLRSEYLRLQAVAHPDRHHTSSNPQNSIPTSTTQSSVSANINSAYRTLQSPLLRAQYLLQQHGINTQEEGTMEADTALLAEVLAVREDIENGSPDEIADVEVANAKRMEDCVYTFENLIREGRWQDAAREAVKLRYWTNIGESLNNQ